LKLLNKTERSDKYMKKIVMGLILSLVLTVALGGVALAQANVTPNNPDQTLPVAVITNTDDLEAIIATILNWIFFIFVTIAVVMIILAGLQFVTGGGDPAAVSAARTKLIWAAVGIGIALSAQGFRPVVEDLLGI
jgi:hypothetical protein